MYKLAIGSALLLATVSGCSMFDSKKPDASANSPVTDITPAPMAPTPVNYNQVAPPPMMSPSDNTDISTTITPGSGAHKGNYTVKRGDTLWSIAKTSYGDGKQYTKIVSANPGLSPTGLKVGQQIVIP